MFNYYVVICTYYSFLFSLVIFITSIFSRCDYVMSSCHVCDNGV